MLHGDMLMNVLYHILKPIKAKETPFGVPFVFGGDGGIPGATGAVPPPARGAEKPFTGWFFASARSGRALRIPQRIDYTNKKQPPLGDCFLLACLEGFEPPTFWSVAKRSIQLS